MYVSSQLHNSFRHPDADIELALGEHNLAQQGQRLLIAPYHIQTSDSDSLANQAVVAGGL